jgi:hypothetical protein
MAIIPILARAFIHPCSHADKLWKQFNHSRARRSGVYSLLHYHLAAFQFRQAGSSHGRHRTTTSTRLSRTPNLLASADVVTPEYY